MNPNNLSFGSGSPLLGGTGQLAQQMEQGAPALNQQSPVSPSFTPDQQVNPYPPIQASQGMSILPPQGKPPAGMAQPSAPKTEAQLIIEALANRLKSMSELQHKMHDAQNPQPVTEPGQ